MRGHILIILKWNRKCTPWEYDEDKERHSDEDHLSPFLVNVSPAELSEDAPSYHEKDGSINISEEELDQASSEVNLSSDEDHRSLSESKAEEEEVVDDGVYVGDTTWEERTWKEVVRLRENMFWARIGGMRWSVSFALLMHLHIS